MSNSFDLDKIIRPNIKNLKPYHSARQDFSDGLLLDANENSLGAPYQEAEGLHRYPDPSQSRLRDLIADWRGLRKKNVFTGVGSDEGIDLLYRIFCRPGKDRVLTTPPTYGMYTVSADIHNIAVESVLLTEESFQLNVNEILDAINEETKLLFLCSPNNPTGNTYKRSSITKLIEAFPGIVIIDEAYIDFSDEPSWASEVVNYPNLVVLQTLSKSFGMAGIRLGISYASEDIINYMMKVKAPYNINKLTSRYAVQAFENLNTVRFNIDAIKKERNRLRGELEEVPTVRKIYPSEANFLLVKIDDALTIYNKLTQQNVIVRYRGNEPLCDSCLRITVGTPDENKRLISALKQLTS